tara:strand:+ start:172 stop:282 length:111 start_codon:yes stop_codon:yes gene_type:complete
MTVTVGLLALAVCFGLIYLFVNACATLLDGLCEDEE